MEKTQAPETSPTAVGLDLKNWQRTVVFLMAIINYVMGEPGFAKLQKPLDREAILSLADQLMSGSYHPREWFQADSRLGDKNFIQQFPTKPDANETYCLLTLPGEDSLTETLNLRSGGIIYEDPFWFILAAYNINKTDGRLIIPRPVDPQKAWQSRLEVLAALHNDRYQAEEWFAGARPLTDSHNPHNREVSFIEMAGTDLIKLRTTGYETSVDFDLGIGRYLMYKFSGSKTCLNV